MASRKLSPYAQPENIPSPKFTLFAQPKNIPSSSFTSYSQPNNIPSPTFSLYMTSQRTYQDSSFISYGQPKNTVVIIPLFALSRSQHHGPSSSRCRRPSTSPSCSVPGLSYYRMSPLFCPTSVTRLLLPAYRRFARRGTREAKPGSVYPSRTVFCLSQLTSIFWLVIPSSKYKQKHTLNRLNHQSLTINTRSSGQVRQFSARFLPLEKEQGHQTQL